MRRQSARSGIGAVSIDEYKEHLRRLAVHDEALLGASSDEIVASLEAVTPVTGAARVVQCAPKVALRLGYDVDAALERLDR